MSYVEKHLIPGESVQYQTKLHWIVMLGHALISTILVLVGVTFLVTPWSDVHGGEAYSGALRWFGLACIVAGAIFFSIGLLKRKATEMAVTNKRVIVKTGIAERRTTEILLSRIESVAVDEPALGRLFGFGTVIVRGTGGTPEVFEKIYHPLEFREQVQRQIARGSAAPRSA